MEGAQVDGDCRESRGDEVRGCWEESSVGGARRGGVSR